MNTQIPYQLRCVSCKKIVSEKDTVARCNFCGEALDTEWNFAQLKKRIKKNFYKNEKISITKYQTFYPLASQTRLISLSEGNTPLMPAKKLAQKFNLPKLFIKNEGANPTGVFKDRGSVVEISKALELGAKAVVCASTGNMAASVSAYAAMADLPCYVLIPENTPLGKLAQAMSYGARILSIRGTYADCCDLAEKMAEKYNFYLAGDYVFRSEGQKTIAFEIIEQLGWQVPDAVIVPIGCGTNISAIWKGFVEFEKLGLIKKLPKMFGVQPRGCSTVVSAFQKKSDKSPFVAHPQTICSAVGIGKPLDDVKALSAMRDSKGNGITVADSEAMKAQRYLGECEAIFVEPSGALPVAALSQLCKKELLKKSDTVVLIATGTGLKDPKSALDIHPTPPSVEPVMEEVERFLKYKLYAIRGANFDDKQKIIFKKLPTLQKLNQVIQKEFSADLKKSHLREILLAIEIFFAKGKVVAKVDLQNLVEEVLSDLTSKERVMRVQDYHLSIAKKKQPHAEVVLKFLDKTLQASARGVGPVDAVISAIRKALKNKSDLRENLSDFEVFVDANGVDATTEVRMKLTDSKQNFVVSVANSPDIITAAISAFEKGYNILYWKNRG
jgi:threonine synthase